MDSVEFTDVGVLYELNDIITNNEELSSSLDVLKEMNLEYSFNNILYEIIGYLIDIILVISFIIVSILVEIYVFCESNGLFPLLRDVFYRFPDRLGILYLVILFLLSY